MYLSISPRRNWLRFVPLSRMISARAAKSGALTRSAPPSPAVTFFVSWKLVAARSPSRPAGRSLYVEPRACAASSMTSRLCRRARATISSISQGTPA